MSWFDTAGIASFAKSALNTAQKTIDKALDIQEEKNIKLQKHPPLRKNTEAESFFEAFGLSDKSSTSQSLSKPSENKNAEPQLESEQNQMSVQGSSGFWTDTWGSFFEMKNQNALQTGSKSEAVFKESVSSEISTNKTNTVLAQPHRAGIFPVDAQPVSVLPCEEQQIEGENKSPQFQNQSDAEVEGHEKLLSFTEFLLETVKDDIPIKDLGENSDKFVITEQPFREPLLNPQHDLPNTNLSLNLSFEKPIDVLESPLVDDIKQDEFICDTESNLENGIKISHAAFCNDFREPLEHEHTSEDGKCMAESEFLDIDSPIDSPNTNEKVESDYDVIDISESETSKMDLENSCDSFTRSSSVEVVASVSQCSLYENNSSTLETPNLPSGMTENIVNWKCTSPDLYVTDENENSNFLEHENDLKINQTLQMASSDNSFHTINESSFDGNNAWVQKEKSSHFIDESQNSSNEEQNSHHSDGSSNSSKDDDDTDTAEVKEYDAKSSSSNGSHTTSSSSFVKCSVEENENCHREQSPVSTSASERSDATKQESEQNTSGDENETATSSDIEILSPPNGENGDRNTSPLKHVWLSRPLRFRRSESPTSDSSKDSIMPVVSELEEASYETESNSAVLCDYKEKETSCHKVCSQDGSFEDLLQKQELQNILVAREKKILELSKENIELQENEERLKNLVQKMRVEQAKESRDITALTREFTQRLSQVENQLREAVKERDMLRTELEEAKVELAKRISAADVEEVIKEKDQQIKELTEEGQKLSKKELQHTTIIKKLRAKEEELERTLKSQTEKLEENSKEVERLRKSIGAKEEQEKKHIDAIRLLTNSVKKLEKEVCIHKSNLEDSLEKELSLKKSLDSTYKDLTEQKKLCAAKEKELEDLKSGLQLEANENLRQKLENAIKDAAREKEMLLLQMQELRCTLSLAEEEANSREKMFKADIASLQKRLQEADERNEDLTKNVSTATRPLVRQIENLQATYNAQTISWEKIEKNLTDRLSDAQNQMALISEKERATTEKYLEYQAKTAALESQNSSLRQEKLHLSTELESLKTKIMLLKENKSRESYTIEKLKQDFNAEITRLKQENENLESTIDSYVEQLDVEKRKVLKLEEESRFKEARALIMSGSSPCPSPTGSARSSVSSFHNWSQDEANEHGISTPVNNYRMSVYESLRLGNGSSLIENLQSQLKQREGEIIQLQSEIAKLEKVKESMTRELVLLSEQNEELDKKLNNLESIEKDFKDIDQKYNTLLQMYGEKVEETVELHLDLDDVKSMYKAQIEELLRSK